MRNAFLMMNIYFYTDQWSKQGIAQKILFEVKLIASAPDAGTFFG